MVYVAKPVMLLRQEEMSKSDLLLFLCLIILIMVCTQKFYQKCIGLLNLVIMIKIFGAKMERIHKIPPEDILNLYPIKHTLSKILLYVKI